MAGPGANVPVQAYSSKLSSEDVFKGLVERFGLTEIRDKFKDQGWTTAAKFAIAGDWNPQHTTDKQVVLAIAPHIYPEWEIDDYGSKAFYKATPPLWSNVKLLLWHCVNMLLADTALEHATRPEESARPIVGQEREERRKAFQKKFNPWIRDIMVGPKEPAFAIENDMQEMIAANRFYPYMGPEDLPDRDEEERIELARRRAKRGGGTKLRDLLKVAIEEEEKYSERIVCSASTKDEVELALIRRGIAFELMGLMAYEKYMEWLEFLFDSMKKSR